ncbi:hypothetical protein A6D6_01335 [Alcanivorax xiamenensis]|uniref:DUF3299 domain-containing protein n=1 Tax=Alcanivorax xiamenensis TaxID=1177156 RepID=A0ABQ6YA12_9GAMM|nr:MULTISPECIES: DUF3299 domain-containing protein [Alcanivorax]KAF0806660.1 hypothetical protein A6D6_01335 [Alcanivorax xiamenensis]
MRFALVMVLAMLTLMARATPVTLEWDHLIPEDWNPEKEVNELAERINRTEDEDPEAMSIMDDIQALWNSAPLQESLDDKDIRLVGFGVPLEGDADHVREFLLVPYFGACIHAPPPPRNQIILVRASGKGVPLDAIMGALQVTGTLKVTPEETEYGQAGYSMKASDVKIISEPLY